MDALSDAQARDLYGVEAVGVLDVAKPQAPPGAVERPAFA